MRAESPTSGQASSSSVAAPPQYNPFAYSPVPARFPLARLSTHFTQDGFTECLFVFPQERARQTGNFAWSWAATLTFLSGLKSWTCLATKDLTTQFNKQSLTEFASDPYLATSPFKLRKTNRGYWLAKSGDVQSPVSPVSDLPYEAGAAPTFDQLLPLVRKRKADNLTHDIEQMKKRESDIKEALLTAPALRAKMQQELDEIKRQIREEEEKNEEKNKDIEAEGEMEGETEGEMEAEMEGEMEAEKSGGRGKGKGKEGEEEEMEAEKTAEEEEDDDDENVVGGGVQFTLPIR